MRYLYCNNPESIDRNETEVNHLLYQIYDYYLWVYLNWWYLSSCRPQSDKMLSLFGWEPSNFHILPYFCNRRLFITKWLAAVDCKSWRSLTLWFIYLLVMFNIITLIIVRFVGGGEDRVSIFYLHYRLYSRTGSVVIHRLLPPWVRIQASVRLKVI